MKRIALLTLVIITGITISSCGPGQILEPTLTPVPTLTPTPVLFTLSGRLIDAKSNEPLTGNRVSAIGITDDGAITLRSGTNVAFPIVESDNNGRFEIKIEESLLENENYQITVMVNLGGIMRPIQDKDGELMILKITKGMDKLDLGDVLVKYN